MIPRHLRYSDQALRQAVAAVGLAVLAALLMGPTWPRDDAGVPAGQCAFIGSTGVPTLCSTTDPLPTGAGTSSTTDPTGWGRLFFQATPTAFSGLNGVAPFFVDDQTVLAFQLSSAGVPRPVLTWFSSNGGRTFALTSTSTGLFNVSNISTAVRAGTAGTGFVLGVTPTDVSDGLLRSADGTAWAQVDLPSVTGATVHALGAQGNTVLAHTDRPHLCRSTNGGSTFASCTDFAAIAGPCINTGQCIASPSANIWLVGDDAGDVARSTDDGGSFVNVLNTTGGQVALTCLSSTVCLATDGASIRRSTDAGATWTTPIGTVPEATRGFVNFGSGVVVAVTNAGTNRFLRSADFGASWALQGTLPVGLNPSLLSTRAGRAVYGSNPNSAVVVYAPIVGAGETLIAGQSGNRWEIDPRGAGETTLRDPVTGDGLTITPGLRLPVIPFGNFQATRACSEPAANTAATVTLAGVASQRIVLYGYVAFYTAAPAAPQTLTIVDGATNVWLDVVAGATTPTRYAFGSPMLAGTGNTVTLTLPAGGAGVSGKLCATLAGPLVP